MKINFYLKALTFVALLPALGACDSNKNSDSAETVAHRFEENPVRQQPGDEQLRLINESIALYEAEQYAAALERISRAHEIAGNATTSFNMALYQARLNQLDSAYDFALKAHKLLPKSSAPLYLLGLIEKFRANPASSKTYLQRVLARRMSSAAYYQLGLVEVQSGNVHQARQAFIHALNLDERHKAAYYQLLQLRHASDDASELAETFRQLNSEESVLRVKRDYDFDRIVQPMRGPHRDQKPLPPSVEFTFVTWHSGVVAVVDFAYTGDAVDTTFVSITGTGALRLHVMKNGAIETRKIAVEPGPTGVRSLRAGRSRVPDVRLVIVAADNGLWAGQLSMSPENADATVQWRQLGSTAVSDSWLVDIELDGDLDVLTNTGELWINGGELRFSRKAEESLPRGRRFVGTGKSTDRKLSTLWVSTDGGLQRWDKAGWISNEWRLASSTNVGNPQKQHLPFKPGNDRLGGILSVDNNKLSLLYAGATEARVVHQHISPIQMVTVEDFNNDGWQDVLLVGENHHAGLLVNRGEDFDFVAIKSPGIVHRLLAIDVNSDQRLDLVGLSETGELIAGINTTGGLGRAMTLDLEGSKTTLDGRDALVEIWHGERYSRHVSDGKPIHIGLGDTGYVEVLRITWANKFVENKFHVEAGNRWHLVEADRISGSCPSLYVWNGGGFSFLTDAFISGPMGVPYSEGRYFSVDNNEYIKTRGVKPIADDVLEFRLVEELKEAVYLDSLRLVAVDHPEGSEVYADETLGPIPRTGGWLKGPGNPVPAPRVVDSHGADITGRLADVDHRYADNIKPARYRGLAEEHFIAFDIGDLGTQRLRLFLTGWFYYFDSSSMMAIAQDQTVQLMWPTVEAFAKGEWQHIAVAGVPPGKGKNVVVDLSGKIPDGTKTLRIRTNVEVYWDQLLLDNGYDVETEQYVLSPRFSALDFRGFSRYQKPAARWIPETFEHHPLRFISTWNPLDGKYTRYGDVQPLLAEIDDKLLIMGTGDELRFRFDISSLPAIKANWRRDYFVYLHGWVKDGDLHTAHAEHIEPLPFNAIKQYPYTQQEAAAKPAGRDYQDYLSHYQTREPFRFTGPQR